MNTPLHNYGINKHFEINTGSCVVSDRDERSNSLKLLFTHMSININMRAYSIRRMALLNFWISRDLQTGEGVEVFLTLHDPKHFEQFGLPISKWHLFIFLIRKALFWLISYHVGQQWTRRPMSKFLTRSFAAPFEKNVRNFVKGFFITIMQGPTRSCTVYDWTNWSRDLATSSIFTGTGTLRFLLVHGRKKFWRGSVLSLMNSSAKPQRPLCAASQTYDVWLKTATKMYTLQRGTFWKGKTAGWFIYQMKIKFFWAHSRIK